MRVALALLCLSALHGCKKGEDAPADAEPAAAASPAPRGPITITHEPTRLTLVAPETWVRSDGNDPALVADLRRPARQGETTLAPPRLVVMARKRDAAVDVDRALDREVSELKTLQGNGAVSITRTARARRLLGGVDMGELRVDYRVSEPKGGADAVVAHRVWAGGRPGTDGAPWEVLIVVTHLADDEDWVAREVEDMLRSIHFDSPAEGGSETNR